MGTQFNTLNVPDHWRQYYSKYPEGYTILESLLNWVGQVDDMVANINDWNTYLEGFLGTFDTNVQERVTVILNDWLDSGLLAEVINSDVLNNKADQTALTALDNTVKGSIYIDNITQETLYDSVTKTTYYIVRIPYTDSQGNVNKLKRGFANDLVNTGSMETVRSFSKRHNASLAINASIFDTTNNKFQGMQIQDGQVINTSPTRADRYILGVKTDGTLKSYDPTTTGATILADGCNLALTSFIPLIQGGAKVAQSIFDTYAAWNWKYRRQVIAQMANKDYLILSCESDTLGNVGLDLDDCVRILLPYGVQFAFLLDGGGSEQTVVRGTNIVSLKDDEGKTERGVPDILYWAKDSARGNDKDVSLAAADAGEAYTKVKKLEYDIYNKTNMNAGYVALKGAADYTGQGIEVWKGDVKKYKLTLNETTFGFFDYVAGDYIFQVGLTSGDIITRAGAISNVNQYTVVAADMNFITKSGWVWGTTATLNTPSVSYSWAIQTIALSSTALMQIAHRYSTPFETWKRRLSGTTWSAWEKSV